MGARPRRETRSRVAWGRVGPLVAVAWVLWPTAACTAGTWSPVGGDDRPRTLPEAVGNALSITLGPTALQVASARLHARLESQWPEGLSLEPPAGEPVGLAAGALGPAGLSVTWDTARLTLQDVSLQAGPAGLTLRLAWEVEPLVVHLEGLSKEPCALTLGGATLEAKARVSLARGALAEVKAAFVPTGDALLQGAEVPLEGCGIAPDPSLTEEGRATLGASLGQAMWQVLGASGGQQVVAALGADVAGGATLSVWGDGLGLGVARMQVGVSEGTSGGLAKFSGGALVVPLAVSVEAERHPCVGPMELPAAPLQALPSLGGVDDAAVSLHAGVIERAVAAVWATGLACGDHLAPLAPLDADEVRPSWPALSERLGPDVPLDLRLWPEAPLAVEVGGDAAEASLTLRLDRVRVELMATLDGARVRVVTVLASVTVGGGLEVTREGALWLDLRQLDVTQLGTEPGLLDDPPDTLARTLAAPVVRGGLVGYPLWTLPPVPSAATGPLRARLEGGYVVFQADSTR